MKILIFHDEGALKPIGGPSGYLYNIYLESKRRGDESIDFIKQSAITKLKREIKKRIVPNFLIKEYDKRKHENGYINMANLTRIQHNEKYDKGMRFAEYDAIHFHNTFELYRAANSLENYRGKVVLTSHSPKVYYRELIEDYISKEEYERNRALFDSMEEFDRYAFLRADAIIFPCAGAEEPYYHSWPQYSKIRDSKKIYYLPTGIEKVSQRKSREEIRKALGIPEDCFVISFVGRHSKVKGYDILSTIATKLFEKYDDIYVVCCGVESDIEHPMCQRWIEIGWTDDPHSIVASSDVFVLPNRETYFDIALLQALSVGKCALISNTGGNKQFEGCHDNGIFLYNDIDEAVKIIERIYTLGRSEIKRLECSQRRLFENEYNVHIFYSKYIELMKTIIEH